MYHQFFPAVVSLVDNATFRKRKIEVQKMELKLPGKWSSDSRIWWFEQKKQRDKDFRPV